MPDNTNAKSNSSSNSTSTTSGNSATANSGRSSIGKWLLRLVGAFVAFILIVVLLASFQPTEYGVSRSTSIKAPASAVFARVNDFHKWEDWSPWAKLDPKAKNTFEGPSEGKDSVFRWDGNNEVGAGSMTILESVPHERIRIRLDFIRPFADTAGAEFTFKEDGENTTVTWSMQGRNNLIGKVMCLIMNMEKMIGGSFESGLASMKQVTEQSLATPSTK